MYVLALKIHLMISASKPSQEMLKLLQERGADVNKENALGYTPLHVASGKGHTALVANLIAGGAQVVKGVKAKGWRHTTSFGCKSGDCTTFD